MPDPQGKKVVWLINQYAGGFADVTTGRHFNFARELIALGYDVVLVMASRSHLSTVAEITDGWYAVDERGGVKIIYIDVPSYKGASSVRRVWAWFVFAFRLLKLEGVQEQTPDIIYYSSLSLVGFLGAEKLSKKINVPLFFEVRDVWPLTLVELGGVSRRHPLVVFLQWVEDRAYKNSKYVFSNLENLPVHIKERIGRSVDFEWLPNGVNHYGLSDLSEYELSLPDGYFVVGYTGSIGTANAMMTLIKAAEILRHDKVFFVIAGDGEQLPVLKEYAKNNNISNVLFLGKIAKSDVPSLIKKFDSCYIGWGNNPLYRFGIGANKIPEYLYSGKPILHSYSGEGDPVARFGAGITVPAEDPEELSEAILRLKNLPDSERDLMGINGRSAAERDYLFPAIARKIDAAFRRVESD